LKKVYIAVLFVIFLSIIGFATEDELNSSDLAANILMGGQNIGEEYGITLEQYDDVMESTVYSLESQGTAVDDYFDNQDIPSKVGLGYFTVVYLGNDQIVKYYATQNGLLPGEEELNSTVDEIYNYNVTTDEVASQVILNYGSVDAFKDVIRDSVRREMINENVMNDIVSMDTGKIKEYFNENIDLLKDSYEKASARHILVETEEEALNIKNMIENEELSFTEAASKFSIDTGTKDNGGDLGEFSREQMVPEFSNAVFDSEIGVITDPVKSDYGYHLILVDYKTSFDTLEEFMESEAYPEFLEDYKNTQFEKWIVQYKNEKDFSVEILIPDVKLYAEFFSSASEPEKLTAFYQEIKKKVFADDGSINENATNFELVTYIQVADMNGESDSEIYNDVVLKLYERLPENITIVQLAYTAFPDSPEVIVGYERMRLNDIESILYDPNALQQYFNMYGNQLIDLIYYVLDGITENVDKIVDSDAAPEVQVKAIDLGLESLEIYSLLTSDQSEKILNYNAEIELLEKKLILTGDETINEMINEVNGLIEEAKISIQETTEESTELTPEATN
jgi:parvulin-like peptidyl-prolyl isomerase